MIGLDSNIIDKLNLELALNRIRTDIRSDFILAPHYKLIYEKYGKDLWDKLSTELKSGRFEPSLPKYVRIPKASGLIRPGAILEPMDRLTYQILTDFIAQTIEDNLDRTRVFSNILLKDDPNGEMFIPARNSYNEFKKAVMNYCDSEYTHAIKTDVACFFDTIYQHILINSLRAINCPSEVTRLLEELLLSWRERQSHGIIQGLFPSDLLGNFYLSGLDYQLSFKDFKSFRYVDDIIVFCRSRKECLKALIDICTRLRKEGLFLNEGKTSISEMTDLIHQETELDQLFNKIRELHIDDLICDEYGFGIPWDIPDLQDLESQSCELSGLNLSVVEELYSSHSEAQWQRDAVIKFSLPILARVGSHIAVNQAIERIATEPHLTKIYCSYLATVARDQQDVTNGLCDLLLGDKLIYDWQYQWLYACLLYRSNIKSNIIDFALKQFCNRGVSELLRGIASIFIGVHGNANQRRSLRDEYENEPSNYVRAAILFCAQYFPSGERTACKRAWGGHTFVNSLIAKG